MVKKYFQMELLLLTAPTNLARVLTPPKTRNCPFGCGQKSAPNHPGKSNTFQKGASLSKIMKRDKNSSGIEGHPPHLVFLLPICTSKKSPLQLIPRPFTIIIFIMIINNIINIITFTAIFEHENPISEQLRPGT